MKIQKLAPGLLSLLGLKTMGNNPGEFAETIAPTFQMRDWMMFDTEAVLTGFYGEFGGIDNSIIFQECTSGDGLVEPIPNDEVWWVRWISGHLELKTVGDQVNGSYGASVEPSLGVQRFEYLVCTQPANSVFAAGASQYLAFGGPVNRFFRGGARFGIHVGWLDAADDYAFQLFAAVTKFKV